MTWVASTRRGRVRVRGPDTWSFLQSLVSADVESLTDGDGTASLLLTPQGKLGFVFRIMRVGDDAWLDIAPGFEEQLAEALARYRIRINVEIEADGVDALVVRGGEVSPNVTGERILGSDWPGVPGIDVLGPSTDALELLVQAGTEVVDGAQLEVERIRAGIPVMGAELTEGVIPQEALLERTAVSFTKGCFVGQELVCRIDTRGHVNKLLRRVDVDAAVAVGATLRTDEREVGTLTSVAERGGHSVALAFVRHEVEPPATVVVTTPDGEIDATVAAL